MVRDARETNVTDLSSTAPLWAIVNVRLAALVIHALASYRAHRAAGGKGHG
jgi:hypothetical protein